MTDPETEYLLARAREETVLAIQAENPAAAAAHAGLAVRYSAKAVIELADSPDGGGTPPPIAPQLLQSGGGAKG